jgi:hypothetical protein
MADPFGIHAGYRSRVVMTVGVNGLNCGHARGRMQARR